MDHIRIIKRAFNITRVYRALWLFGVLLALTTASGQSPVQYSFNQNDFPRNGDWPRNMPPDWNFNWPALPSDIFNTILAVGFAVLCIVVLLAVVFTFLRYISNTALIRMVSGYEASGERVSVGEGFRIGWSRASFRTWLIDLFFTLAGIVVVVLSLALVAAPLLLWTTGSDTAGAVGSVMAIGLFILWLLVVIVAAALLSLVLQLAYRAVVLEEVGVFDGIRRGWGLFRRRLGDTIIMGLILFGIGLAFSILMIPVFILLLLSGVVVGGIPALLAGALTNIWAHGATPQIVAAAVGVPILLAVLIVPIVIIGGLFETFKSAAWTLTYREMVALEGVQATPVPQEPPAPQVPPAPQEPPMLTTEI